ncbi:hypothetical protein [Halorhabdus amylolytica]|uniref:hypothetical protein n=1 Tax=Halorhabdus amylolytica TaxID=2559573 RepID=UPI0010A9EF1A|nr:hypothetical protein [Halorhabdus amylolytica]
MSAIDPKDAGKYAGRLFGYFLTVTVVGGGITLSGVVLLRNNGVFSGGSVDVGAEVIVGGALTGVGALVILAGFFTIVLNVIADGVRFGVAETASEAEDGPEQLREPAWPPNQYRPATGERPPVRQRPPVREPNHQQPDDRDREPEENEPWKREVEEKLADEDRPGQGDNPGRKRATPPTGQATGPNEPPETTSTPEGANGRRSGAAGEAGNVEREPSGGSTGRAGSDVEREPGDQIRNQSENTSEVRETSAPDDSGRTDSETWVSGEDVSNKEPNEGEVDRSGEPETSASEDPLAPGEIEESDSIDADEESTDSPAWLEESDEGTD